MTSPDEFPALVTDYEVDWDTPGSCGHEECREQAEALTRDGHYEHGFIAMPNGYTVSVLRADNLGDNNMTTEGFEDGLWEATLGTTAPALVKMILGVEYLPPSNEVFEQVGIDPEHGRKSYLDNAGVNAFLVTVAALPAVEEVTTEDLGGLFS